MTGWHSPPVKKTTEDCTPAQSQMKNTGMTAPRLGFHLVGLGFLFRHCPCVWQRSEAFLRACRHFWRAGHLTEETDVLWHWLLRLIIRPGDITVFHWPRKWENWEEIGLLVVSGFSASPSFWNTVFQASSASTACAHAVMCDAGVAMHLHVLRNWAMWIKAVTQRIPGCCSRCMVNCTFTQAFLSRFLKWKNGSTMQPKISWGDLLRKPTP